MHRCRQTSFAWLLALVAICAVALAPAASADEPTTPTEPRVLVDPNALADTEFVEALEAARLLDDWFAVASHANAVALLQLDGDERFTSLRQEIIWQAEAIARTFEIEQDLAQERARTEQLYDEHVELITASMIDAQALADNDTAAKASEALTIKLLIEKATSAVDVENAQGRLERSLATLYSLRSNTTSIDDLPVATIDAYVRAAGDVPATCSVDWTLLAGIGRIESLHGTLNGSSVDTAGNTWPHIFGPLLDGGATERLANEQAEADAKAAEAEEAEAEEAAKALTPIQRYPELYGAFLDDLADSPDSDGDGDGEDGADGEAQDSEAEDGDSEEAEDGEAEDGDSEEAEDSEAEGNGFAVIADTDGGELDQNPDWDRAVGPMQFIPGTWALFATDGNNDGWADPHNLYDAAASAATYLCHLEARDGASPSVFIRGYNNSSAYVADVLETSARLGASYPLPTLTAPEPPATDEASDDTADPDSTIDETDDDPVAD